MNDRKSTTLIVSTRKSFQLNKRKTLAVGKSDLNSNIMNGINNLLFVNFISERKV